jgi:hypothetical protein
MTIVFRVAGDSEEYCPYLRDCHHRVPRFYFINICNSGVFNKCQHYAKRARKLKTPLAWLQRHAVEKSKKRKKS